MNEKLNIGVWLPLAPGSHWRGEGIARTVEFIIDGSSKSKILGKNIQFTFFVTQDLSMEIKRSLTELLDEDIKHINFLTIRVPWKRRSQIANSIFSLFGLIKFKNRDPKPYNLEKLRKIRSAQMVRKFYRKGKQEKASKFLGLGDLIAVDIPNYKFLRRQGVLDKFLKLVKNGRLPKEGDIEDQASPQPFEAYRFEDRLDTKYTMPGLYIFISIMKIIERVPLLRYFPRKLRSLYDRSVAKSTNESLMGLALANSEVVDVWWIVNPNVYGAEFLPGPRVANFWDFVVGEYGYYWTEKEVKEIYSRVKLVCHSCDEVITQSFHNRDLKLGPILNVPETKVNIVYLSYPESYPDFIPKFAATGCRDAGSRSEAAKIIKHYVSWRLYRSFGNQGTLYHKNGFMLERFLNFDFEGKVYAIISTQDRPYKNLTFILDAFFDAVNKSGLDAYVLLTSKVDLSNENHALTKMLLKQRAMHRVFSLPRVPNNVHAALYHCASLTIHPSFSEGGVGSYPFVEGMVMGCPGLVGHGDYSVEGQRLHPDYTKLIVSPYYKKKAAKKILKALRDPDQTYTEQKPIFDVHRKWTWSDVSVAYLEVFKKAAGQRSEFPTQLKSEEKKVFFEFSDSAFPKGG